MRRPTALPTASDLTETKLVADAMLGSLARKLRAFGLDTSYYRTGDDAGLLHFAESDGRVLLTADKGLASRARSRNVPTILVKGNSDARRLTSILNAAAAQGIRLVPGASLCSLCGGPLIFISRQEAMGWVPQGVVERHRTFLRCSDCGQHYWKGSHWKKLRWLARALVIRAK